MLANTDIVYSDFRNDFSISPFTGDLMVVTNEKSVTQAIKNLVLTSWYERTRNMKFGGNVYKGLFENYPSSIQTGITSDNLKIAIINGEPRVDKVAVNLSYSNDGSISAKVIFTIKNTSKQLVTDVLLKRVR